MYCKQYDAVIIGAGFAGLSAALKLKKAGLNTILLEAAGRTGGRVKTIYTPDGTQIELGGQWIGPTQDKMYQLARKYKATVFPTYDEGRFQVLYNGSIREDDPEEVQEITQRLDDLAATVNRSKPWKTPEAEVYDKMTFHTWLKQQGASPEAVAYISRSLGGGLLAADAEEFSMLQMMFYIKSGFGLDYLDEIEGGAQQDRVAGGLQFLTDEMAKDYGLENIYFNQPVKKIKYDKECAEVFTDTAVYRAAKVLIAIPTAVMDRIEFCPALPVLKKLYFNHMMPPTGFKAHFTYETPFWRSQGISGNVALGEGYVFEAYDNSPPEGDRGVVSLLTYGTEANDLRGMAKNKRIQKMLDDLEPLYGAEIRNYTAYFEYDWSHDPYINGGFSSHPSVGGLIEYGRQQNRMVNPLYWAGTEYAKIWNGYCDGAVRSGQEVAGKIIRHLQEGK